MLGVRSNHLAGYLVTVNDQDLLAELPTSSVAITFAVFSHAEVPGFATGVRRSEEELRRAFLSARFVRVLDALGYARFMRWRVYGEEALAGGRPRLARAKLLRSSRIRPQLRLFPRDALGEGGRLKFMRLAGYAPRVPGPRHPFSNPPSAIPLPVPRGLGLDPGLGGTAPLHVGATRLARGRPRRLSSPGGRALRQAGRRRAGCSSPPRTWRGAARPWPPRRRPRNRPA